MTRPPVIKSKDRDTILNALRSGVVPRIGLQHIQVGRKREIEALLSDIERVASGGGALRFVIGEYGAGKTFFLFLIRQLALAKNLVVMQADLSPDKRLYSTTGHARTLYAELAQNAATRTAPDGGALRNILERFVGKVSDDAKAKGVSTADEIRTKLDDVRQMAGGYEFASVVTAYARGYEEGSDEMQSAALRWLRGEYVNKTAARQDLDVRTIIDDGNVYDNLKLLSRFVRHAGYSGLFVCLDELVTLYKLQSAQSRKLNFDQILRVINDVLQGSAEGIGFALGGTPEFLLDTRRGLYSDGALQSRLAEQLCKGRLRRLLGTRDQTPESHARRAPGSLRAAKSAVRRRRSGEISCSRRGVGRVRGPLPRTHRRQLFPNPAQQREGVRRPALDPRTEPEGRLALVDRRGRDRPGPRRLRGRHRSEYSV